MTPKSIKLKGLADFLEEQDIVSLIRLNLILFIMTAVVGISGFLVFRDAGWSHFARNGLLLLIGSALILYLLHKKQIPLAVYSSLTIYGVILTYAAWTGAGVKGTMYSLFFLLVVGAALVIGRRAAFVTAFFAVLVGLVLLLAGRAGWLLNIDRPAVDVVTWITLSTAFIIVAHLVSLVIIQAERAIAAAQAELVERVRAEMEVRRLNDELEQRVRERTSQLAAREAFLSGILDGAGDAILTVDETQHIRSFSKSAEQIFGYTAQEVIGQSLDTLIPVKSIQVHRQLVHSFGNADEASRFMGYRRAVYGRRKDGTEFPAEASISKIMIDDQRIFTAFLWDVTERKRLEKALHEEEQRIRGLLKAIPETIFELSREGMVLQYVPSETVSAPNALGDIVGKSVDQVMPPVAAQIRFAIGRTLESGELHVIEFQLGQDGGDNTYEGRLTVSGKDSVMLMARDISLYKRSEIERERMIDELERRNAESESLRETSVIVASTLDVSEAVQRILKQLKRVILYDSASVWLYKGMTAHLVGGDGIPEIPEADRHYRVAENEPDYPLWSQGLPYILLDDVQTAYPQFREPPINYIRGWMGVPMKVRGTLIGIISLDSQEIGRFTHEDAKLALTYANQVSIAVENARLFSELQVELEERKALIEKLDAKNSEMESFTYSVSHDLKSPLFTIRGFMSFLQEDIAAGRLTRVEGDVQRIIDAMDVMQQRLDDLLELSRAGQLTDQAEVLSFHELVAAALELVHGRISQRGIRVQVEENLPSILGDRRRLLEVLQNLLDNAAKFMGEQADPRIEVGQRGTENGKLVFFIRDNGIGIAPEHHEKIFGIFNKLNPKAQGTGIGLSLVKKIVEAHKGRIWVESEAGKGCAFYFTLPRS